ncbi:hypothetical protein [Halarcobacter anaerophilus]|jgi:uncharacterized membrane protein|uniref:Copper resistance protein D domain-containing protein n=1 Tax=Halarcobacter anaerophilus TaxID=877500 RepID=A0A4Q0Y280_9BACT|nr:hypothetical protein [Halarcobacter anaerophilus]QDF27883.1 putative membrane protein [Halarcobacter anaerophilus]RXJ64217.1 hypothetical protein CRV06_04605 [Halarcobacter anaerophilus]
METLFHNFSSIIVFLHVISAVIWVGGMIAIRLAVHYSMQEVQDPKIKLGRTLENLRRFFNMVIPSIIVLLLTAIIMIIALGFKGTPLYSIVIAKESVWTIMTIVFAVIFIKRNQAQKAFDEGKLPLAKEKLAPIANYLIPLNILLGIVAIYLGITLRGF